MVEIVQTELPEAGVSVPEFSRLRKRLREFEEVEISRQSCRRDCEKKGGKLLSIVSELRPRIRPIVIDLLEERLRFSS